MTDLKYVVQDPEGEILSTEPTPSFKEVYMEARGHAQERRQDVFIVSDDPEDERFPVRFYR